MKLPQYLLFVLLFLTTAACIYLGTIIWNIKPKSINIYDCHYEQDANLRGQSFEGVVIYPDDKGQGIIMLNTSDIHKITHDPTVDEVFVLFTNGRFDINDRVQFSIYTQDAFLIAQEIEYIPPQD